MKTLNRLAVFFTVFLVCWTLNALYLARSPGSVYGWVMGSIVCAFVCGRISLIPYEEDEEGCLYRVSYRAHALGRDIEGNWELIWSREAELEDLSESLQASLTSAWKVPVSRVEILQLERLS